MGLATPQRVGSSRTRDQTHVPCIGCIGFLSAVPSGKSQVGYFCLFEGIAPGGYLVHSSHYSGLPWWLDSKESACNVADLASIPGLGSSPGGGHGNPLQYSCLENPMGRGAWRVVVHGVSKSRTRLSDQAPAARSIAVMNHGAPLPVSGEPVLGWAHTTPSLRSLRKRVYTPACSLQPDFQTESLLSKEQTA